MLPALAIQVQGLGSVTSDNLNGMVQGGGVLVADLRAFAGLNGMTVWLGGTTALNDNGQGMFFWDAAATAPDDDGVTTIQPNGVTGSGRWLRQPSTPSNIPADSITYDQLVNATGAGVLGALAAGPIMLLSVAQLLTLIGASAGLPPGMMAPFGALAAPAGWLICDGSAQSRTTYAALFGVIGATFGSGDGSTTFNLPDMRGQFPRGYDTTGSIDPGRTFGTTQLSALQSHQHIETLPEINNPSNTQQYQFGMTTVTYTTIGVTTAGTGTVHFALTNDGTTYSGYNPNSGGQVVSNETRPTNVAVSFIIKT